MNKTTKKDLETSTNKTIVITTWYIVIKNLIVFY